MECKFSHIKQNDINISILLFLQQTCVAGDRVLTDPVCKPFSMGRCSLSLVICSIKSSFTVYYHILIFEMFYHIRNLLCVYSKKHMNDIPELVEMKKRANNRSLKEMALLLRYVWLSFCWSYTWWCNRYDGLSEKSWREAPMLLPSQGYVQLLSLGQWNQLYNAEHRILYLW